MTPVIFSCLAGLFVGFFLGWILCALLTMNKAPRHPDEQTPPPHGRAIAHCARCEHLIDNHDRNGCVVPNCGCPVNILHV